MEVTTAQTALHRIPNQFELEGELDLPHVGV